MADHSAPRRRPPPPPPGDPRHVIWSSQAPAARLRRRACVLFISRGYRVADVARLFRAVVRGGVSSSPIGIRSHIPRCIRTSLADDGYNPMPLQYPRKQRLPTAQHTPIPCTRPVGRSWRRLISEGAHPFGTTRRRGGRDVRRNTPFTDPRPPAPPPLLLRVGTPFAHQIRPGRH